jgi:lipid-A-disaccharide synthase
VRPRIVTAPHEKIRRFRTARAALAASGTVTLELALAQVPMVAAYRFSGWEAWLLRLMTNVDTVILPTWCSATKPCRNICRTICTADRSPPLVTLCPTRPSGAARLDAFVRLDAIMDLAGRPPSQRAADAVLRRHWSR